MVQHNLKKNMSEICPLQQFYLTNRRMKSSAASDPEFYDTLYISSAKVMCINHFEIYNWTDF